MKKIMTLALAFVLAMTMGVLMVGCGSGSDDEAAMEETTTEAAEETTEETTEAVDSDFAQFKQTMDDYEAFFDSYCELMENYNDDPVSYMDEYAEMMQKYAVVMEELDEIDEDELTDEELAYYLEVMGRINQKLAEVAN